MRADLVERLEAHADMHANVSPHDDEQAQWEADLREAATALRALRDAPVGVVREAGGSLGAVAIVGEMAACPAVGAQIALVPLDTTAGVGK
jgi:hypothetical protein